MARTDTHRPSAINPDEYIFVSFHDHRAESAALTVAEMAVFREHMNATGGKFSTHEHGGVCHICGNANAMSVARFWHEPSNTYIEVGETCADKLGDGEALNFRSFREKVKVGLQANAGKRKAQAILESSGLSRAWQIYCADWQDSFQYQESTIRDIVGKLVRYGSLSEKQHAFLQGLVEQIEKRAEIELQRKVEHDNASPIPMNNVRALIKGKVLSVKPVESFYGDTLKMLVQHRDGWKIYGTVPNSISNVEIGDFVSFEALISVSDNDSKFGFFKRPTKAKLWKGE